MTLHINRPRNPRFLVRARVAGYQKYQVFGKHRSRDAAWRSLCAQMATGKYKRGDVLMVTNDYYGPTVLEELVRSGSGLEGSGK